MENRPLHRRSPRRAEPFAELKAKLGLAGDVAPLPPDGEPFKPHRELEPDVNCAGMVRLVDQSGPVWMYDCDGCSTTWGMPMLRRDPQALKAHRLEHSGIPERFAGRKFTDDDPDQEMTITTVRKWLREFKDEPLPAIALYGRAGRGKSHLLALMVETLIKRYGTEAIFRSAVGLLDELKEGFDNAEYETRWHRVLSVPVLALDDLGAERVTDWKRERLEQLLDHRYAKELPVLITTNVRPQDWPASFGERANSRLRGLCVALELRGADKRYMGEQERLG